MRAWVVAITTVVALAPFAGAGCGTDATGVQACKQIEEARCRAAPRCPAIQLTPPYYTSGSAIDACVRFYDTACLHGLEVGNPSPTAVNACVAAISSQTATCNTIESPETNPECSWLIPPASVPDASDAGAGEAGDATDAAEASMDAMDADNDSGDGFGF